MAVGPSRPRIGAPAPALVISLLALIIALGGTSYAAFSLPKNSVGTKQLKNGAVTAKKIKNGAITAAKINAFGFTAPNAAHATSADSAASANTAATATNATNAATASALAGVPAAEFAPLLYAHVYADGTVDGYEEGGFATGGATVSSGGGSAYCISNLPFSVRGGSVSIDYGAATAPAGRDSADLYILESGEGSGDCPGAQVEVATFSSSGTPTREPFYVVLYGCRANGGTCSPVPASIRH